MRNRGQHTFRLSWLLFTIGFLSIGEARSQTTYSSTLPVSEFAEKIKAYPDALVIDVRTPGEFAKGHIPNAKNIDWNGDRFTQQIAILDKTMPVFVYCLAGSRSADAMRKMRTDGFTQLYELKGGILKWRAAGLPEEHETTSSRGMTKPQFDQLLISDKLVLIDFYADWCAPCKKMKPSLDKISQDMSDEVTVLRINADDNPALCNELNVDALPMLLLYEKGALIWKNTGYLSLQEIETALASF